MLKLAREMGVLRMGIVALDGTKIHANASHLIWPFHQATPEGTLGQPRHSALSYEQAGKIEAQLKAEVVALLANAEAADKADVPEGMEIPAELARRETRLEKLAQARAKIEERTKERCAREQADCQAKLAAREAKAKASGRNPGSKPLVVPLNGPLPAD